MAEIATTAESTASVFQPDDDAEPADRFPFMRFCPEIRVMIWNAAMPDFAPCHFILHSEGDNRATTLTLILERMTKSQRTPIATLSTVCHESRNEVILKYPDLLRLRSGHLFRFSSSKDVVMLTALEVATSSYGTISDSFRLIRLPNSDNVIHFPSGWNAQVQNIAFEPANAPHQSVVSRDFEKNALIAGYLKPRFDFLSLFPQLKNCFAKHTVVCASETLEAVKKEWQETSIQMYVEQEFTGPEHIPLPYHPGDYSLKAFNIWQESAHKVTGTFLRKHQSRSAVVDNVLHHMMRPNTQDGTENQAVVTRLRGINYLTMVGFWKCRATHSEVVTLSKKRCGEVLDFLRLKLRQHVG